MSFEPTTPEDERIAGCIVDAAIKVHKTLGPGLLEHVYEVCLCHELRKRGFKCERQVAVPITYDGIVFDEGFRVDLLVEDRVVCELKAVDKENPVWKAQLLSYLRMLDRRLGFIINFNVPLLKDGIRRMIV